MMLSLINVIAEINNTVPGEILKNKDLVRFIVILLVVLLYLSAISSSWAYYGLVAQGTRFRSLEEAKMFRREFLCAGVTAGLAFFLLSAVLSIKQEIWYELVAAW